ncbi:MAG: histidinol-phosphate transaminase [Deltaproteobacteria bacterium]|nr:histidinol-phosphate transaminase [Deltaproteobacteria bacterium]
MKLSVPDYILAINPYSPGKPLEELEREYGISDSIKLASNENPLGPSPLAVKAIHGAIEKLNRYPDGSGHDLVRNIAKKLGVAIENVVLGNGSDEIIGMIARTFLRPGDEAIIPYPSFLMYNIMVCCAGATPVQVPLKSLCVDLDGIRDRISSRTRMIFICNPNNPTGTLISKKDFKDFLQSIPDGVLLIVDEAYIEFVRDKSCAISIDYFDFGIALVTLRTFSKAYGLAGLRIGYGIMPREIASLINRVRQPFNANSLAQVAAVAAMEDKVFLGETISLVHEGLDFLYESLDRMNIKYFPTQANFFLIDVGKNADEVFEKMLRQGIIVRSMTSYGYSDYIRINVGLHEENVRFLNALEKII